MSTKAELLAEITRLREYTEGMYEELKVARAEARREALEEAAAWHDARAAEYVREITEGILPDGSWACRDYALAESDAIDHQTYAQAIRALAADHAGKEGSSGA